MEGALLKKVDVYLKKDLEETIFQIKGVNIKKVSIFRIPKGSRVDNLYYYDIRHDEYANLVAIEKSVLVHYFGAIITDTPLPFNELGEYVLTKEDVDNIYRFC